MERIYFITGIDTGVGKTVATGLLARSLRRRGVDAITVKLVQTGNDGLSEDLEEHRRIAGGERFYEDQLGLTSPQVFRFPASPRLAAEREGRTVDVKRIEMCVAACARQHSVTLVESAGGLDVPLTADILTSDIAASNRWPVILVTCGRLGAINHALLTLEAIRARGMPLAGVVHNSHFSADPEIDADAETTVRAYLSKWGFDRPFVRIPSVAGDDWPDVDFSGFFA